MKELLEKQYKIESTKYGISGVINDYGVVIKLIFSYGNKEIEIGLSRPFPCNDFTMKLLGQESIDSYVDHLVEEEKKDRKTQLHYWYINEIDYYGKNYKIAHGIVSGHTRLMDATYINTSEVKDIVIDKEKEVAIIRTGNSEYHCPLEYCYWRKQDRLPDFVPEYDWIRGKYENTITYPTIEDGKVLLVLSNFDEYYFNSLYYRPFEAEESLTFSGYSHIGMFQDSYIIECEEADIDIRYYPHYQNIEFYEVRTAGKPLYIENIGDITLYVKSSKGLWKLEPGERKEITKENAEKEPIMLPNGDLYLAKV